MSITVDLYQPAREDGPRAGWFACIWVARDDDEPVGALMANAGGTISLVAVAPDRRGEGIPGLMVNAVRHTLKDEQYVDGDELTYAYPISEAGERVVEKHHIPLYEGRHATPFERLENDKAEGLAADLLCTVRGHGDRPFSSAPVVADIPTAPPE